MGNKPLRIGNVETKNNLVMAPLAGYSNLALRELSASYGAGLCYTEMISANALVYKNLKTLDMLPKKAETVPVALQLFGGEIDAIKESFKTLNEHAYYDILDFNLGCPVPKVMKQRAGSFWLKRQDELYQLFKTLVDNSKAPCTIKTRLGFNKGEETFLEVVKIAASAGIKAVAIHGRSKSQLYSGEVDYTAIKKAIDLNLVPIIANGDICLENYQKIEEEIDPAGLMIGRGALGDPLVFTNILRVEAGQTPLLKSYETQLEAARKHYHLLLSIKDEKAATLEFRALFIMYLKGLNYNNAFKKDILKMVGRSDFEEITRKIEKIAVFSPTEVSYETD